MAQNDLRVYSPHFRICVDLAACLPAGGDVTSVFTPCAVRAVSSVWDQRHVCEHEEVLKKSDSACKERGPCVGEQQQGMRLWNTWPATGSKRRPVHVANVGKIVPCCQESGRTHTAKYTSSWKAHRLNHGLGVVATHLDGSLASICLLATYKNSIRLHQVFDRRALCITRGHCGLSPLSALYIYRSRAVSLPAVPLCRILTQCRHTRQQRKRTSKELGIR